MITIANPSLIISLLPNLRLKDLNRFVRKIHAPHAKLTNGKVKEIRQRISNGEKDGQIALDYGVTRDCIYRVRARLNWKHVA